MARTHTVVRGDTLSKIARKYYGDAGLYKKLADHNGITNPNLILVGQVVNIPPISEIQRTEAQVPAEDRGVECPHGLAQIKKKFGNIYRHIAADGTLRASWEQEYMDHLRLPFAIPLSWNKDKSVSNLYCHKVLKPVFKSVFETIKNERLSNRIVSYGGCFNYRSVRLGHKLSTHSWGIAIDINPETNRMGTTGDMDSEIIRIFKDHGFTWGGNWTGRKDPMHFQFCSGY